LIQAEQNNTGLQGDALAAPHDAFVIPNPQFTLDWEGAGASVNKIICYHGGEYRSSIRAGLEELEQKSRIYNFYISVFRIIL
jgi:hypothetical protein